MNSEHVRTDLSTNFDVINRNLQDKNIGGQVVFCNFDEYDGAHISLWMNSEALENSSRSIENYVGRQGTFEVVRYDICKHKTTILLNIKGKCPVANDIREIAKIRRKSCYSQHMTVGKFKNLDVPEEITKTQYGYKKILAEEYLKINILTNVKVDLINEHMEQWALKFHKKDKLIFITVNLEEKYQYIMDFDANSSDDRNKLNQLINTMWQICRTMMSESCSWKS